MAKDRAKTAFQNVAKQTVQVMGKILERTGKNSFAGKTEFGFKRAGKPTRQDFLCFGKLTSKV